jgi:hypothetical protein
VCVPGVVFVQPQDTEPEQHEGASHEPALRDYDAAKHSDEESTFSSDELVQKCKRAYKKRESTLSGNQKRLKKKRRDESQKDYVENIRPQNRRIARIVISFIANFTSAVCTQG